MVWIGMAIGFFIGSILGVITMCLVTAAKATDRAMGIDDKN